MRARSHCVGYRYEGEHFRAALSTKTVLAMLAAGVTFQYRDPRGNIIPVKTSSPSPEIKRLLEQDVIWWGHTIARDWVLKVRHYTDLPPARPVTFRSLVDGTRSPLKRALKTPGIYLSQRRLAGDLPEGIATLMELIKTSEPSSQEITRVFFQGYAGINYVDLTQAELTRVCEKAEGHGFTSWTWGLHGSQRWDWSVTSGEWFKNNALGFQYHRITFKKPQQWSPSGSPEQSYQHAARSDLEALLAYMDNNAPVYSEDKHPSTTSNYTHTEDGYIIPNVPDFITNTENQENTNMSTMNLNSPVPALFVTAVETKAGFVGQVKLGDKIVWESSPVAADAVLPEDGSFHSVETFVAGLAQEAVKEFYTAAFDEVTVTGLAPKKAAKK